MTDKHCWSCNSLKPVTDFYRDVTARDGLQGKCKGCSKRFAKAYRQHVRYRAHPEAERARWRSLARLPHRTSVLPALYEMRAERRRSA